MKYISLWISRRETKGSIKHYHVAPAAEFLAHLAAARRKAPAAVDTSTIELG